MKKLLIFAVFLILASCEKQVPDQPNCYDCTIKQSDGIEYKAIYCCSEVDLQLVISNESAKGLNINCKKQ